MKKSILVIISAFLMSGSPNRTDYYELMFEWLVEKYAEEGIAIIPLLKDFEAHLVEKEILPAADGEGYHEFFMNTVNGNLTENRPMTELFQDIGKLDVTRLNPPESLTAKLTIPEEIEEIERIVELSVSEEIDDDAYLTELFRIMSPSYFDVPYNRAIELIVFFHLSDEVNLSLRSMTPIEEPKPIPPGLNRIAVHLDGNNDIYVDRELVLADELDSVLAGFLRKNKSKSHIILTNSRDTRYDFYIEIQNTISAVYNSMRDEEAHKLFGLPYRQLSPEQQEDIEAIYPKYISGPAPE